MKIEIELPEIEGFEYTGEYRRPKCNEHYKDSRGVVLSNCDHQSEYPILKKKAPKYRVEPVLCASDPRCLHGKTIKMVGIKALTDALAIIEDLAVTEEDRVVMRALQELIK